MGGVCLTLYGFIAVSGLRMFKDIDLDNNVNLMTVSAILIAGIGGLAIQIPYAIKDGKISATINITSIATALILGIATYQIASKVSNRSKGKIKELNYDVKEDDKFRVYLKTLSVDTLAKSLLIFGVMHENVDFTAAQLSNFLRNDRFLSTCSDKELKQLIYLLSFVDKNNIAKLKKKDCIEIIKKNVKRIESTVSKQITAQEIR